MTTEVGYIVLRKTPKGYANKWAITEQRSTNKVVAQNWVDFANEGRRKPVYALGTITVEEE